MTKTLQITAGYCTVSPTSLNYQFPWHVTASCRKENSSLGCPGRLRASFCYQNSSDCSFSSLQAWLRNINLITLHWIASDNFDVKWLLTSSGPANPCTTNVDMETSPFQILKFATLVCYYYQDQHLQTLHARSPWALPSWLEHLPTHQCLEIQVRLRAQSGSLVHWRSSIGCTFPAPSICAARYFGRWVVTHSLADTYFQGHRPTIFSNRPTQLGYN